MSAGPLRLSLFLPRETAFYRALLAQMRRGFEAAGVTTTGLCRHLGADEMPEWIRAHEPHVIFEMNRPRRDAPFIPREVRHIAWIVDFNGRTLDHFEGSEITYLFAPSWLQSYPHRGFHRWFGPGACEHDYAFGLGEPNVQVSFAGHIPRPWTVDELKRDLTGGRGLLHFAQLLPELETQLRARYDDLPGAGDYLDLAQQIADGHGLGPLTLDSAVRYDISGRLIRLMNRADLANAALRCSDSLDIYGSDNWAAWPRYAPYYRGFLEGPADLRRIYQSAGATLHEGTGIHFRSMDCMAAGGLLFLRETAHEYLPGGIRTFFEPHVHYVPFTLDDLKEQVSRYRADPSSRARIQREAAAAIRAAHSWQHRAQDVLRDLDSV